MPTLIPCRPFDHSSAFEADEHSHDHHHHHHQSSLPPLSFFLEDCPTIGGGSVNTDFDAFFSDDNRTDKSRRPSSIDKGMKRFEPANDGDDDYACQDDRAKDLRDLYEFLRSAPEQVDALFRTKSLMVLRDHQQVQPDSDPHAEQQPEDESKQQESPPTRLVPRRGCVKRFTLRSTGESISCVLWDGRHYVTGCDIIKTVRFIVNSQGSSTDGDFGYNLPSPTSPNDQTTPTPTTTTSDMKKFEEGIFSDLRHLKVGVHSVLEESKSEFLEWLCKHGCIRTQKKQKVFYWEHVEYDRLAREARERINRRSTLTNGSTVTIASNASPSSSAMSPPPPQIPVFAQSHEPPSTETEPSSSSFSDYETNTGLGGEVGYTMADIEAMAIAMANDPLYTLPELSTATATTTTNTLSSTANKNLLPSLSMQHGNNMPMLPPYIQHPLMAQDRPHLAAFLQQNQALAPLLFPHLTTTTNTGTATGSVPLFHGTLPFEYLQWPFGSGGSTTLPHHHQHPAFLHPSTGYHSGADRRYICSQPHCYKRFKRMEHLKRHLRIHTGERPFVCPFPGCAKSFSRSDNLAQHLKIHIPSTSSSLPAAAINCSLFEEMEQ